MYRVGILTVSDKGSRGERKDESGMVMREILEKAGYRIVAYTVVPDEEEIIARQLKQWADELNLDLILTTGGTGLTPRDVTPEATLKVIERPVPGIAEALRMEGLKKTPHAMLSRGVSGIRGQTLIANLPGSPKAVREGLEIILPALPHALAKVKGDPTECGVEA
ncbi:MAG: MogA/MoaB family molybdenum cofactor biosynthesis protein [Candidatus Desulfofervidaceae bacterium]|nr:MogA/MoaB family molybdenum cofactor biosynthesis protein [Candidatus Desulfofervidaceae bacterium]MDL1971303.1 MogA/MoaB family molybdenum cofactor biosynthesis protein [Candidatus Desulfofervidaceae bacterium]